MSYDIKIWSINKAKLPESLPEEQWKIKEGNAYLEKKDWQVVVNKSTEVEDGDVTKEVIPLLPGISYMTELNLEPIYAPEPAKNLLLKVSKVIAKDIIGIIEDPQNESVMAPSGVKRFIPAKRERDERFSVLKMAWWFGDSSLSKEEISSKLVDYFEKNLPEALPRRYGQHEPPQYKYLETGKEQFKKYLIEHIYETIVWYPTKPVISVGFSILKEWGFYFGRGKKFFRANSISIEFDSNALDQPGWKDQLQKIFKDISLMLNPFYGEVRRLNNHIYGGGTYFSDPQSEQHPIAGGRWMGIPQKLGLAIVVGKPYLDYLPKLKEKGKMIDSLCFASMDDWASNNNINSIIGDTPKEIAQIKPYKLFLTLEESLKRSTEDEAFPPIFPFNKEAKE